MSNATIINNPIFNLFNFKFYLFFIDAFSNFLLCYIISTFIIIFVRKLILIQVVFVLITLIAFTSYFIQYDFSSPK